MKKKKRRKHVKKFQDSQYIVADLRISMAGHRAKVTWFMVWNNLYGQHGSERQFKRYQLI